MRTAAAVDWAAARAAVAASGPRVGALLRSARRPGAPALGTWNVAELAAHLSHALDAVFAMSRGGGSLIDDLWGLPTLSGALVAGESERDLGVLAERIERTTADLVAHMEAAGEDSAQGWIVKGVDVPLSFLTCHALNELLVHGRDIALAEGVPWPIERPPAALVVCGFLFPAINGLGRAMVDQEAAAGQRICFHIKVRGGCDVYLRIDDGTAAVEPTPWKAVDCHLSVDPAAFLLVAWARIGQGPAIAKGQLLAWGRKPWLGLKLRSLLRNP